MEYMGYKIEHERSYYRVTAPDGSSWTEDTVQEAKFTIGYLVEEEQING